MTNTTTQLTINGLNESIAYCEAMGLSKCFEAYASIGGDIIEDGIGFNPNSGYVYIALENGISICSMMGKSIEYLVTNFSDGEEYFFDTYEEAEAKWQIGSWNDYESTDICSMCGNDNLTSGESCNCLNQK